MKENLNFKSQVKVVSKTEHLLTKNIFQLLKINS